MNLDNKILKPSKRRIQCKWCRNLGHIHYFNSRESLHQHIQVIHGVSRK